MSLNWTKMFLVLAVTCIALFGDHSRNSSLTSASLIKNRMMNTAAPVLTLTLPTVRSASGAISLTLGSGPVVEPQAQQADNGAISQDAPLPVAHPAQTTHDISEGGSSLAAGSDLVGRFYKVADTPAPQTGATVTYVADFGNAEFLSQNAAARWPMASLTKLMTAIVVSERSGLTDAARVSDAVVNLDDTRGILHTGDTYSVNDLLHVMLVYSSNVAAETLAAHYGRNDVIAAMNAKAKEWGMADTNYDDPSGLSSANQSTAQDLAILAGRILTDYPQIFTITRTPQVTVTELGSHRFLRVKNINEFAGQANFIGGKTGYTDDANGNLLSVFRYHNHPVLFIVLGTANDDRFADTSALLSWFKADYD